MLHEEHRASGGRGEKGGKGLFASYGTTKAKKTSLSRKPNTERAIPKDTWDLVPNPASIFTITKYPRLPAPTEVQNLSPYVI